ncbi:MAG: iron-containing alcohol dehydrogenase [Desulfobacterales bacterium]|nr:iron-containing alcohol dehydrogenase [Desulfobacterales bacterium]
MYDELYKFYLPSKIILGTGLLNNFTSLIKDIKKTRIFILVDKLVESSDIFLKIKNNLNDSKLQSVHVCLDESQNATVTDLEECLKLVKDYNPDCFISIGGKIVCDIGKALNAALSLNISWLFDYKGSYVVKSKASMLPYIFIPTLEGASSALSKIVLLHDSSTNKILKLEEEHFIPNLIILDALLSQNFSPQVIASSSIATLADAIESCLNPNSSPFNDIFALQAIKDIYTNIFRACSYPEDFDAINKLLTAGIFSSAASFNFGKGQVSIISYCLSIAHKIPYPIAKTLVLPEILELLSKERQEKLYYVADAMQINLPQIIDASKKLFETATDPEIIKSKFGLLSPFMNFLADRFKQTKKITYKTSEFFDFIDEWSFNQGPLIVIDKIKILIQKLAYLANLPLNFKDAGISLKFFELKDVVKECLHLSIMLNKKEDIDVNLIANVLNKIYYSKTKPLQVSKEEIIPQNIKYRKKKKANFFKDHRMIKEILFNFYKHLISIPEFANNVKKMGIFIKVVHKKPSLEFILDARENDIVLKEILNVGEKVEGTLIIDSDFAHKFWHGKASLVKGFALGKVSGTGNLTKAIRLIPSLKMAFKIYPVFLRKIGMGDLIIY